MTAQILTSELMKAARGLLRWDQVDLGRASGVSIATIKRLEAKPGELGAHGPTVSAIRRAFELSGIQFIPENGGGAGVRLAKPTAET